MSEQGPSTRNVVVVGLSGILLLAFAAGIVVLGQDNAATAEQRIDNAVEVDATILTSEVDFERRNGDRRFFATVEFEYTHEGERYQSDLLYPTTDSKRFDGRSGAVSVVDRYPEGTTVTAFLDPEHPDAAFLNDEPASSGTLYYVVGAAAALFGLLLVGDAVRRFRKR